MKKGKKVKEVNDLPKTQLISQVIINVKPNEDKKIDELPGYEKEDCNINNININSSNSVCWNCCHCINDEVLSQPIKYENNVFTTVGNFCSYSCISRYIIDSNESSENIFNKLSTLNLYYNIKNNTNSKSVTPAPSKLVLKMFGGYMDIDEYRLKNKEYLITTNIEPIVKCIDISVKELHIKKNNSKENMKEFKLYRKNKKVNTNDIYESMNLVSEE
uniref:MYM-type domain-containing protein n=1 Tax=viral metagenome TaxID=1070528 RepID=A0A6C0CDJ2_9ZZZZ